MIECQAARSRTWRSVGVVAIAVASLWLLAAGVARAAGVQFLTIESREAFLAGTLESVSVDPLGRLRLADEVVRSGDIEEPFLFAGATTASGWVFGTGNAGRIVAVDREGDVTTLFSAPEPSIFALWVDPDGTIFAGSSPDGKVYRIADGEATEFFDPGETYIWQIARAADGDLLVATGTEGRLYKVDSAGEGSVFYDGEDTHARALKVLPDGEILLGTAGNGLILSIDPTGRARTLHDSVQSEVVAFAAAPDGICYAAVLSSEASLASLNSRAPSSDKKSDDENGDAAEGDGDEAKVSVEADAGSSAFTGSRPQGFSGPRSELLRIRPSGGVDTIGRFDEETIYDLLWSRERLWVATGLNGRLYSLRDDEMVLESSVDERQIVALVDDEPGPAFATTNAAALFRTTDRTTRSGTYTSAALDAGQIARFGSLRWRGEGDSAAEFSFRSGMSSEPDETWSEWTAPRAGSSVPLADLPDGRYLQWRAELKGRDAATATLGHVTISYRQLNLAPRIESLTVLEPGQILVPQNFNPGNQTFEVTNPNRGGIFTTLGRVKLPVDKRSKTLWKGGFRTLRWEASDANDDELTYTLSFRPETGPSWLPMIEDHKMNFYSFDATVLPDGLYRFRLEATDAKSNGSGESLAVDEVSELVVVDNTPPSMVRLSRDGDRLKAVIDDRLSPLREAMYSVDAGEWQAAVPVDGLLDGDEEAFLFDPPADGELLLFRVVDAAHNVETIDLSEGVR